MAKAAKMRVPLSVSPEKIISLSSNIFEKHRSLGPSSPLKTMEDHDWDVEGPNTVIAQQLHNDAVKHKGLMEKAYRERDLLINRLDSINKASRTVLAGVYSKNMKRMSDWGFEVDDTPKAKKQPKTDPAK